MCAGKDSERVEKARQHEDQLLQCHHTCETSTLTICQSMHFHKLVGYFHKPYIILFSLVTHGKAVRGTAEIWRSSKYMLVCVNMF